MRVYAPMALAGISLVVTQTVLRVQDNKVEKERPLPKSRNWVTRSKWTRIVGACRWSGLPTLKESGDLKRQEEKLYESER